ncbi:MAG: head GIN domain-containing protein [Bacteroidaceae bacterium]|nr:DUF2807 domain-containing protein [Bacteroidaceae bacterium]
MKTKYYLTMGVLLVSSFLALSCTYLKYVTANKIYITKKVDIPEFSSLQQAGSIDVVYRQEPGKPRVEIYGSDNIVPLVITEVKNNVLIVRFRPNTYIRNTGKLEVRVFSPEMKNISLSGSGELRMPDGVKSDSDLSVSLTGSGDLKGKFVQCQKLSVQLTGSGDLSLQNVICSDFSACVNGSGDMSLYAVKGSKGLAVIHGSGDVKLSGEMDEMDYQCTGSGDIYAKKLKANNVSVASSGSGDIDCYASKAIKGSIHGSGSVNCDGNPALVNMGKRR